MSYSERGEALAERSFCGGWAMRWLEGSVISTIGLKFAVLISCSVLDGGCEDCAAVVDAAESRRV